MKYDADVIAHWFGVIETDSDGLTEWEEEFVESTAAQFARRGTLSDKQVEILERIYAEKTP